MITGKSILNTAMSAPEFLRHQLRGLGYCGTKVACVLVLCVALNVLLHSGARGASTCGEFVQTGVHCQLGGCLAVGQWTSYDGRMRVSDTQLLGVTRAGGIATACAPTTAGPPQLVTTAASRGARVLMALLLLVAGISVLRLRSRTLPVNAPLSHGTSGPDGPRHGSVSERGWGIG